MPTPVTACDRAGVVVGPCAALEELVTSVLIHGRSPSDSPARCSELGGTTSGGGRGQRRRGAHAKPLSAPPASEECATDLVNAVRRKICAARAPYLSSGARGRSWSRRAWAAFARASRSLRSRANRGWRKALSLGRALRRLAPRCFTHAPSRHRTRRRCRHSKASTASRRAARWRACRRGSLTSSCTPADSTLGGRRRRGRAARARADGGGDRRGGVAEPSGGAAVGVRDGARVSAVQHGGGGRRVAARAARHRAGASEATATTLSSRGALPRLPMSLRCARRSTARRAAGRARRPRRRRWCAARCDAARRAVRAHRGLHRRPTGERSPPAKSTARRRRLQLVGDERRRIRRRGESWRVACGARCAVDSGAVGGRAAAVLGVLAPRRLPPRVAAST